MLRYWLVSTFSLDFSSSVFVYTAKISLMMGGIFGVFVSRLSGARHDDVQSLLDYFLKLDFSSTFKITDFSTKIQKLKYHNRFYSEILILNHKNNEKFQ
jgi:hypothetical protein